MLSVARVGRLRWLLATGRSQQTGCFDRNKLLTLSPVLEERSSADPARALELATAGSPPPNGVILRNLYPKRRIDGEI